ncbi:transporter, CPA2 family [Chitinophaga rupis]|uniref:Transporter, CPA2 family n=1 Tax=Chitinophaga rupis TaxID=573321 RepID=A0A1H7ZKY6_9BACT|nr:cation:proton antiporter [Chitinophaga rupis]SEM58975.1 transporter, CPA2 family [Chitinophaga rupis]
MHNILLPVCVLCLVILLLIVVLKKARQPYMVAYILAGIVLGPNITGVFSSPDTVEGLGEIGILLLMFFLGMENEIPNRKSLLFVPVIAQIVKTIVSFLLVYLVGRIFAWPLTTVALFTVLLIFNSTAVVSGFLKSNGEIRSLTGKTVLNILLLQDVLLAPVLTFFQLIGPQKTDPVKLIVSVIACIALFFLLRSVRNRNFFASPVAGLENDHELQVFTAACICLGLALIVSLMGLTASIGSFAAGIFIGRVKGFHWLEHTLGPFKVFFTALFFVSVGIRFDVIYLVHNWTFIAAITVVIMLVNSVLSAGIFHMLRFPIRKSIYAGALLSQTGEFGILACSLAYQMHIIPFNIFKACIAVTALSLLLSSVWISVVKKYVYKGQDTDRRILQNMAA